MVQLYSRVSRSLALPISKMPSFIIPLADKLDSSICGMSATFTRNSTATYIDDDSILQTAGIDVTRFQNGRYLCEPDGTNIALFSEELTNAYWQVNNITKTGGYSDPFGRTTGTKLKNTNSTANYILCRHLFDNIPTGTSTGSVFVKKGNHRYVGIRMFSTSDGNRLVFDFDTETLTANGLTAGTYGVIKLANGWYRLWHNQATVLGSLYYASVGLTDSTGAEYLSIPAGSYIYATGFQVEAGTRVTSYITTTTVPMGRVADVLHYAVGDVITQGQGSLYCEFYNEILNSGASRVLLCLSDGTSSNRLYFQINSSNFLTFLVVTGGSTVGYLSGSGSSVIGLNKVLLTCADNNMRLYLNGAASGEDLSGVINTTVNKLSAGCLENGATQANRELGNIKYFKEVLTPAQAIKLTTL